MPPSTADIPTTTLPAVQVYTTKIIYRASALGGCPRALWAARNSYTPQPITEKFKSIFARGHEIETIVTAILESSGWKTINRQYEVHIDLGPICTLFPVWILGHIDFDSTPTPDTSDYILTEVKGFGSDFLAKYQSHDILAFPTYCAQISTYLHARNQSRWRLIIYKKNTSSAEDSFDRLIIREYETPPYTLEQLRQLVTAVEKISEIPVQPTDVICTNNYPCPYRYLHNTPDTVPLTDWQISAAKSIKTLDKKIEQLTRIKDTMRGKLQQQLSDGKFKSPLNDVSISFSTKPYRITTAKVEEIMRTAGVDESTYKTRSEGKQMRISVKDLKGQTK